MTPEKMKKAIPGYYQAWANQDRDAVEAVIGDPFSFTSPFDDHIDRAEFFRRCWPNASKQESFEVQLVLPDGEDGALVLYEARIHGGKTIRNTEYLRFDGEQLRSVEVYFGLGPGEKPTTPQAWAAGQNGEHR